MDRAGRADPERARPRNLLGAVNGLRGAEAIPEWDAGGTIDRLLGRARQHENQVKLPRAGSLHPLPLSLGRHENFSRKNITPEKSTLRNLSSGDHRPATGSTLSGAMSHSSRLDTLLGAPRGRGDSDHFASAWPTTHQQPESTSEFFP